VPERLLQYALSHSHPATLEPGRRLRSLRRHPRRPWRRLHNRRHMSPLPQGLLRLLLRRLLQLRHPFSCDCIIRNSGIRSVSDGAPESARNRQSEGKEMRAKAIAAR
jgi:hypothetical protein